MTETTTGCIELPGGWSIPKDQMPEPPFDRPLITGYPGLGFGYGDGPFEQFVSDVRRGSVKRGGIKYPTPTERTHTMTETPETEVDLNDLPTLLSMRAQLDTLIREKQDQAKRRSIPPAPPMGAGGKFTVRVRYQPRGTIYQYLIYRAPDGKGWYSTGQGEDGYFSTWKDFVQWLRRPEVYWHSALQRLVVSNEIYLNGDKPNESKN
ncbi:hypothetical protein SEA_BRUHMOMENT_77 [Arthrobacter phage BruhMoment]|nr:hypothetical protein SEA_BRUHMOMENT_77 [Arthrobacter phage BruhMoment]